MRALVCAAAFSAWTACGSPPPPEPEPDAGEEEVGIASSEQIVAWEGQVRFVTVLSAATGDSLEGATVAAEDPDGPLEVIEQRCAGSRCAVVVRVRDLVPNTGMPIPAPIDGRDAYLRIERPNGPDLRTLIRVMPLDTIDGGGTTTLRTGGVRLASSAQMPVGASFGGHAGGHPLRWVIFGEARFGGTIDVSGDGAVGMAGGAAGGAAGASADGPTGGRAGEAGEGGGGGGGAEPGRPGDGSSGEPGEGGAGGAPSASCALDFFADDCGGGGGGGAAGPGGGGGGTLVLVSLGELDLSMATLRAAGGDGAMGGGGGGGGFVALAAPRWRPPASVDVAGGAGEGAGGDGGAGAVHVQVPTAVALDAVLGPAVDLAAVPTITSDDAIELAGRAAPGARVVVEEENGARFEATADPSTGAFTVGVTLEPGLNRFSVTQERDGERTRSWVGTSIDLDSRSPGAARPVGAYVDVAYLP